MSADVSQRSEGVDAGDGTLGSGSERSIRIATWNLHGFFGEGAKPDFERTLRLLRVLDADILALQEIDGRTHLKREPRAFERLAEALGGHISEARLFGPPGREYGHLVWSRWPFRDAMVRRLPGPGFEPRAMIDATVRTPCGDLRVLAAHFGLRPLARRNQARYLADLVEPDTPTLALGDFNEWRRNGAVARALRAVLPREVALPSWPARRPFVSMDRLYAGAGIEIANASMSVEAAFASDHLPLLATLRLSSPT